METVFVALVGFVSIIIFMRILLVSHALDNRIKNLEVKE